MPWTAENQREYMKEYRKKNADKIAVHKQTYRDKNRQLLRVKNREYYQNNKEIIAEKSREYREDKKDEIAEYKKEYNTTPKGKKVYRISGWKQRGIISEDYDALYERVISTKNCEFCGVSLTEDKTRTSTTRCLDHDHETGQVRGVLCHSCNIKDVLKST